MKSYVVTKGSYSDYRILGVFSTKENADDANKIYRGTVEEFELDQFLDTPRGMVSFTVRIDKAGNVSKFFNEGADDTDELEKFRKTECYFYLRNRWDYENMDILQADFLCHCLAKDETTAIKIASEKRFMMLANNIKSSEELEAK